MLHTRSEQGPKSSPEINPDRTQTKRTQVAQKTLKKKHQMKSIKTQQVKGIQFFSPFHATYTVFSQHLPSLILKMLMVVALTTTKGRLLQLFNIRLLKKCLNIVVLKGCFFDLKLCPLVISYYQLKINVPRMGPIHSRFYEPLSCYHAFDDISCSVFQFLQVFFNKLNLITAIIF